MNPSLKLSRARLRHDAPAEVLRDLLSRLASTRMATGHRLIWTLFGDTPERERDFLWREAEPGVFYLLSARPPEDRLGLFRLDPAKPFAPVLAPGERLHFVLRANATIARKPEGMKADDPTRGKRCDIVMDALKRVPRGQRSGPRQALLPEVAHRWLAAQGEKHGFALARREMPEAWEVGDAHEAGAALDVMGYRVLRLGRGGRRAPMQVGVLDLKGTLEVREPARFLAAVAQGFGRAKAFGCGLMLIRRAL